MARGIIWALHELRDVPDRSKVSSFILLMTGTLSVPIINLLVGSHQEAGGTEESSEQRGFSCSSRRSLHDDAILDSAVAFMARYLPDHIQTAPAANTRHGIKQRQCQKIEQFPVLCVCFSSRVYESVNSFLSFLSHLCLHLCSISSSSRRSHSLDLLIVHHVHHLIAASSLPGPPINQQLERTVGKNGAGKPAGRSTLFAAAPTTAASAHAEAAGGEERTWSIRPSATDSSGDRNLSRSIIGSISDTSRPVCFAYNSFSLFFRFRISVA